MTPQLLPHGPATVEVLPRAARLIAPASLRLPVRDPAAIPPGGINIGPYTAPVKPAAPTVHPEPVPLPAPTSRVDEPEPAVQPAVAAAETTPQPEPQAAAPEAASTPEHIDDQSALVPEAMAAPADAAVDAV